MAKFKYYITNLFDGNLSGTNDDVKAKELSECDEFFVVNAETGRWLNGGGKESDVEEFN